MENKYIVVILFFVSAISTFFLIFLDGTVSRNVPENGPLLDKPPEEIIDGSYAVINGTKIVLEVADTLDLRARGLSGRDNLPEGRGMLFVLPGTDYHAFWMKGMRFSIDIVWLYDGKVVDSKERVMPEMGSREGNLDIYTPRFKADMALELPAGYVEKNNIKEGDLFKIVVNGRAMTTFAGNAPRAERESEKFFMESLMRRGYSDSTLTMVRTIEKNEAYEKFLVSYNSDGIKISGVMNVPSGAIPENGFPVLILNHGLIGKDIYFPGRGSKREQDYFARHGYVTVHPDYRGLGESGDDPAEHHDFYVGYSLDVAHLVDAIRNSSFAFLDPNRIGMWGHSMGGGIAARVILMRPEIRAVVLFAPLSADAEDNFYELTQIEIDWIHETYGEGGSEAYKKISPITYFDRIVPPVQLHHGTEDKDVPINFSQKMFDTFTYYGKDVELFIYPGEKHEFIDQWPRAALRALEFFDMRVRGW